MKLNLSNNKKNESANAASKQQVNNNANDAVMHEVDVIGMITALKRDGHVKLSDHATPVTLDANPVEDAVYEEIKDDAPAAPAPKAETKKKVTIKRKVQLKLKQAPKEEQQSGGQAPGSKTTGACPRMTAPAAALAKYRVDEYTTKKGGTAFLLFGFESKEAAEKIAEECSKTVSASWRRNDKNEQMFCLSMGTRYGDVARELCAALNKGDRKAIDKACAKSHDVYAMAVAAGKAEREIRKQERMAAKEAETKEEAAKEEPAPTAKTYTTEEVAAMLREVLSGKELPKDIEVLMAA